MALFGCRGVTLAVVGLILAVYINYPAPTKMSQDLQDWTKNSAKTMSFRNYNVFYKDAVGKIKDGPILVLLHGFPTNSYDWSKIWPSLLERFSRVIAPDHLGFGFSDKPMPFEYSIFVTADLVEELLASLGLTEVHLLSHDYGDTVGQELLVRYTERTKTNENGLIIKSLCLSNGGIFQETTAHRLSQKILRTPYIGPFFIRLSNVYIFNTGFSKVFGPKTQPSRADLQDFYFLLRKNDGNLALPSIIHYLNERDTYKDRWSNALREAQIPLHLIYGPADPIVLPAFVNHFKKLAPHGSVSVLHEDIGHYLQWEDPEGFAREYLKFVDNLPSTLTEP